MYRGSMVIVNGRVSNSLDPSNRGSQYRHNSISASYHRNHSRVHHQRAFSTMATHTSNNGHARAHSQRIRSQIYSEAKALAKKEVARKKSEMKEASLSRELSYGSRMYNFFEYPDSGQCARLFSVVIFILILTTTLIFVLETLEQFKSPNRPPRIFRYIEIICTSCFTFEYLARLFAVKYQPTRKDKPKESNCYKRIRFVIDVGNIVDLISVLPFFIELSLSLAQNNEIPPILEIFKIARTIRVFRVLKFVKYSEELQLFTLVMRKSTDALLLLFFLSSVAMVLCGSLVYFAEMGTYDPLKGTYMRRTKLGDNLEPSPFTSIPASMYWVVASITTVGYGDYFPTSDWGKFIAIVTMFLGILVLALPITIIGMNFGTILQTQAESAKKKVEIDCELGILSPSLMEARTKAMKGRLSGKQIIDAHSVFDFVEARSKPAKKLKDLAQKLQQLNEDFSILVNHITKEK